MYGLQIKPVAISGSNGLRLSMFGGDPFGRLSVSPKLGQDTDQEWYDRAKRNVADFDAYVERLRKVANKAVREQLWASYVGDASDSESGLYRRNSVASDIAQAESYKPVNYLVFGEERRRNRVRALDSLNDGFKTDLGAAESAWGTLPEPQVIERVVEVPVGVSNTVLTVAAIGAVAVVGMALLGVFD